MTSAESQTRGSILHDYFDNPDGGGRVALTLAKHLNWPIHCGFSSELLTTIPEADQIDIRNIGVRPAYRVLRVLNLVKSWSKFQVTHSNPIVYSGWYAPMAVVNHKDNYNILYCHCPPRYVYDQRDFYRSGVPLYVRPIFDLLVHSIRKRYQNSVKRMDRVIANSSNVSRRLKDYFNIDAEVIYPPCSITAVYTPGSQDYYLSLARHDKLKRVDMIINAFRKMPEKKLVVASGGIETGRLKRLAAGSENIEFTGWLEDGKLRNLIANCRATIYIPRNEDFGMAPVESMAMGKPVIGVAEGGMLETVIDADTGILINENCGIEDIMSGCCKMTADLALDLRNRCTERAARFSTNRFLRDMDNVLSQAFDLQAS